MGDQLVIYVAGPYSGAITAQVEANVERAITAGVEILRRGHLAYVPHLTHYLELSAVLSGASIPYERWMAIDRYWLKHCNALLYLAPSPGADRELELAAARGMRIFQALEEIPSERAA
jgi:hypothetical protein